ncbi:MAG: hypothetical protein ACYDBJ_04260 [Aggregatilineales bacterium]
MERIRLNGRIDENGRLEVDQPDRLPPGAVIVTIEPVSAADEATEEALWDEFFTKSQDLLDELGREIQAEYEAGLTDEFDPDVDPL